MMKCSASGQVGIAVGIIDHLRVYMGVNQGLGLRA